MRKGSKQNNLEILKNDLKRKKTFYIAKRMAAIFIFSFKKVEMTQREKIKVRSRIILILNKKINAHFRKQISFQEITILCFIQNIGYKGIFYLDQDKNICTFDFTKWDSPNINQLEISLERSRPQVSLDEFEIVDNQYKYAVIASRFKGKWLFCKNKNKDSYEIPGGKREDNETIDACALRELREETGAKEFNLFKIGNYSVKKNNIKDYGMLYFAEVLELGELFYEIKEIKLFDQLPINLTYKTIQTILFNRANDYFEKNFNRK